MALVPVTSMLSAFPVYPTPPTGDPAQWIWGKVLSVEETPDTWTWVDVPVAAVG